MSCIEKITESRNAQKIIAGLLIAAGLAMCGLCVGFGIKKSREPVRTVTVKGLSERDVKADLALWNINFVRAGNDLTKTRAEIMKDDAAVTAFLMLSDTVSLYPPLQITATPLTCGIFSVITSAFSAPLESFTVT